MICTPAHVIPLTPARDLLNRPAIRRVCLPDPYARKLRQGHFIVVVGGKPVAVSIGKVSR